MVAITNLSLLDSSAVTRTFDVAYKDGLLAKWQEETPAEVALYPTLSVGMRAPRASGPRKVTLKCVIPVEVVKDGVTTYESCSAFCDFLISQHASAVNVANLRYYIRNAIVESIFSDVIDEGKFPY